MRGLAFLLFIIGLFHFPLLLADGPVIDEWHVPWNNTRPRDPDVAPNGDIWFVGQGGDYVATFKIGSRRFEKIPLDPGTGPHNVAVGNDGTVWYAGNQASHIGKITSGSDDIHKIMMPDPRARDPHTLTFDDAGNIWFTVQGGNFVGKLEVGSEDIDLINVPTPGARPYGIKVHHDTIWVALFGTNKLARVKTAEMTLQEIELPREDARPRRLGITSNGAIWYVDYARGTLGRYAPDSGQFTETLMPSGSKARPYGMAIDSADRIWFVETGVQPNQFVGFDPASGEFFSSVALESGGGTVRHMVYDASRNEIWFGTDANTIGRAQLPKLPETDHN